MLLLRLSLYLIFCHFNYMVDLFGLILFRTLWFLDLDVCFLSQVRKVSASMSLDMFFAISLALLLGLYNVNVNIFNVISEVLKTVLVF